MTGQSATRVSRYVARVVSILIIAAGAIGWFDALIPAVLPNVELPNTDVQDVAIFPGGAIATANPFFERIQIFDAAGRFLRGWTPHSSGGWFCLERADHQISSYSARGGILQRYDVNGRLLSSGTFDDAMFPTDATNPTECRLDPAVASVAMKFPDASVSFLNGRVVRLETQWWHYILPGSFYSMVIFTIGLILNPDWRRGIAGMISSSRKKKR
jgi:hypothetical protein